MKLFFLGFPARFRPGLMPIMSSYWSQLHSLSGHCVPQRGHFVAQAFLALTGRGVGSPICKGWAWWVCPSPSSETLPSLQRAHGTMHEFCWCDPDRSVCCGKCPRLHEFTKKRRAANQGYLPRSVLIETSFRAPLQT